MTASNERDDLAKLIMLDGCGLKIDGELVTCDHPKAPPEIRQSRCGCRDLADRIIAAGWVKLDGKCCRGMAPPDECKCTRQDLAGRQADEGSRYEKCSESERQAKIDAFAVIVAAQEGPDNNGNPLQRQWSGPAEPRAVLRCDQCDNGIDPQWPFCAWCGVVVDGHPLGEPAEPRPVTDAEVEAALQGARSIEFDCTGMADDDVMRGVLCAALEAAAAVREAAPSSNYAGAFTGLAGAAWREHDSSQSEEKE